MVTVAVLTFGAVEEAHLQAPTRHYGVLVVAHGGDEQWNAIVRSIVESIAVGIPLEVSFGMADRSTLQASIRSLENRGIRRIAVVRLFVSGESFLAQTRYLLGLEDRPPELLFDSSRVEGMRPVPDPSSVPPIEHSSEVAILEEGLVDAAITGRILAERALALSAEPERESVLVIAHGMGDEDSNRRLLEAMRARTEAVRRVAPFRSVEIATLREDWDTPRAEAEALIRRVVQEGSTNGSVIVIPLRVAGFGPYAEVLSGLEYVSDGQGLLPHEAIGEWIIVSARRLACHNGWTPSCTVALGR